MSGRETKVEKRLREGVEALGGFCWKWVSPGVDGVPDRIVVLPGVLCFVETKTEEGPHRVRQERVVMHLRRLGHDARFLHGHDEVEEFLEEMRHKQLLRRSFK